ncbi:MAG: hypothetical protein IJ907_04820 [Prevotella sp.]|nr:hypothetical protein [Prevotella sp.]
MKLKNLFLAFGALMALAACSDNLADAPPVVMPPSVESEPGEVPILFSSSSSNVTRADHTDADAASLLGSTFVVSGYKGNLTSSVGSMVFDNCVVNYYPNTANTTESNTNNWEYVGQPLIKHAVDNGVTQQSIKFWDYTKPQYDFIAWSVGKKTAIYEGTPTAGQVYVSKITPRTATGADGTAYAFKGRAADLEGCYVADLVTVKKANYGSPVTIRFRHLGSKVRVGIYETVPGYSVKDVKFYDAPNKDLPADPTVPRLFSTTANQIYTSGTYTVYYPTVDTQTSTDNNVAHVKFEGTTGNSKIVDFDKLNYTIAEDGELTRGAVFLGRSAATASMAGEAEGNYYTQYLPNESGTSLNLRVDYTLESVDGLGETILVRGATAQVPSIYTQWKSGYAYTYLFKISDKTNGHTGVYDPTNPDDITINSDPAGLYPITFDAVVVNDVEDATHEHITLVSTPSITTYQNGSKVVDTDNYLASTGDIYVTVNDGTKATTPDLARAALQKLTGKVALYSMPAIRDYTEAEVVDALQIREDNPATSGTIQGRNGIVLAPESLTLTNEVRYGVNNDPISVGTDKAAKFTPSPGIYAFVYTKKDPSNEGSWKFEPVDIPLGTKPLTGLWRYAYTAAPAGDAQKGVAYFDKNTGPKDMFLGQTVNNLYTRSGDGTAASPHVFTIASGYAVTGTDYYYTLDHGQTYKKAANIPYANFAGATDIYTLSGTTYTLKTDTKPQDGTAYYQKNDADGSYTYCVILPEQTYANLKILADTKEPCSSTDQALKGQTYFDRYLKNDGVYYTKVITVQ